MEKTSKIETLKSISALWISSFLGAFFAFIIQAVFARKLGPSEFGILTSALATAALITSIISFGLPQLWLRFFGKDGWRATNCITPSLLLTSINSIISIIIILIITYNPLQPERANTILLILFAHSLGQATIELVSAKLQLEERYLTVSLWQVTPQLTRLTLVVAISTFFSTLITAQNIAILYASISLIILIAGAGHIANIANGSFKLKGHENKESLSIEKTIYTVKSIANQAWPFGALGILNFIYFQGAIIIIRYIATPEEAGHYSVAFSIMAAVYLIPTVLYQKFLLPKLHRWSNQDQDKFQAVYKKGNVAMLAIGGIAMLFIWATASLLIPLIFGQAYKDSVAIINILALCAPIQFLISSVSASLLSHEHTKKKAYCLALTVTINITLNLLLVPKLGSLGAAISTVASSTILLYSYKAIASKYALLNKGI